MCWKEGEKREEKKLNQVSEAMSSSDTWSQLQAHKRKHENLKERLAKRRKERQGILDPGSTQDEKKPVGEKIVVLSNIKFLICYLLRFFW